MAVLHPPQPALALLKRELRHLIRSRLRQRSSSQVLRDSHQLVASFLTTPEYHNSTTLALYASLTTEVDLRPLLLQALQDSKRVFYPRVHGKDLQFCECYSLKDLENWPRSKYGIKEPPKEREVVDVKKLEVVVTPGLAFDLWGGRLGQGGGFYDRFFKKRGMDGIVALAFAEQLMEEVPREVWDKKVNKLIWVADSKVRTVSY